MQILRDISAESLSIRAVRYHLANGVKVKNCKAGVVLCAVDSSPSLRGAESIFLLARKWLAADDMAPPAGG
jgi:hypothetical protein